MTRNYFLLVIIVMLCTDAFAQNALFSPYSGKLSDKQIIILDNLQKQETTLRVRVVKIDPNKFDNDALQLNFFADATAMVEYFDIGHTGANYLTWTGRESNTLGSAAFIRNNNRISGHFTSINGNFEVAPLVEDGVHMIFEHDNTKFEACGTEGDPSIDNKNKKREIKNIQNHESEPIDNNQNHQKGNSESTETSSKMLGTECFIRLILAYTSGAKTNTNLSYGRTMNEHASLAVLDQNLGHANAQVEQRVELAFLYATTDLETSSSSTDVNVLRNTSDGKWDEIHTHRNDFNGDMCALITDGTYSGLCGRAYGFSYTDPTFFFNVSEYNCIVGNYTMAHEFGHCQGLRHDSDPTTVPFVQAHGYNEGTFFRTIMAVCCSPTRVNYWSNPGVTYPFGGGSMGIAGSQDNADALDAGDTAIASHRTTPLTFTTSTLLGADETLNMLTIGDLTATVDAPSGAVLELKSQSRVLLQPGFHAHQGSEGLIHIIPACTASYSRTTFFSEESGSINDDQVEDVDLLIFPNPANSHSTIQFRTLQENDIRIDIFDVQGKLIENILDKRNIHKGLHTIEYDLSNLYDGMYLIKLNSETNTISKTLLIAK